MYPDVNIFLTLDFQQPLLLRKCTIFAEAIKQQNLQCYQLSTVKNIRQSIITEINAAVGKALRHLFIHISMSKGGGAPHILEKTTLTPEDEVGFKALFEEKRNQAKRELAKDEIQRQEVWAIEKLRTMLSTDDQCYAMDYLRELSQRLTEQYVETKNNILRTNEELNLEDEEKLEPSQAEIQQINDELSKEGFNDWEDCIHIAALRRLKQKQRITPFFATADRNLYDQRARINEKFGVIVEDALYAVGAIKKIAKDAHSV
jgi:hypothetical protein